MYKVLLKSTTERVNFGNLGSVCVRFSNFVKSQECLEKVLAIATEIGDRQGEGRLMLWTQLYAARGLVRPHSLKDMTSKFTKSVGVRQNDQTTVVDIIILEKNRISEKELLALS